MRIAFVGQILPTGGVLYDNVTPIGTILLAQIARQRGHTVRQIVIRLDRKHDWRNDLREFQPEVLCFTVFTRWFLKYAEIFAECRRLLPGCTLVLGGPHASSVQEWTLEDSPELDFAVVAEGERAFEGLLDYWEGRTALTSIPNLIYRQGGKIVANRVGPELTPAELDALPFPAYDLVPESDFRSRFGRKAMVIPSRGCYFRCKFCLPNFLGEKVRSHSPDYTVRLIRSLYDGYGVRFLMVGDALFPSSRHWLDDFLDRLEDERFRGLKWACTTRVQYIDRAHYTRMKALGLVGVAVGVEAADEVVLRDIRKGITLDGVRETAQMLHEVGIPFITNFIVGHRLDTPESVGKILPLVREVRPHFLNMNALIPTPGTPLFPLVPDNEKRYYTRQMTPPCINAGGFRRTAEEYTIFCQTTYMHYYGSFHYLWQNGIRWWLKEPGDYERFRAALLVVEFWLRARRQYAAGMLARYRTLRPGLRALQKAFHLLAGVGR